MNDFRHPKDVNITQSFKDDSLRRDISINALGLTKDGEVVDYQGGVEDIKNKIIRAVGEPKQRFIEDALRLLRVLRFSSKLGFTIEPKTLEAIKELNYLIDKVSKERITDELMKTAAAGGKALANFIERMDETGMLEKILPEVKALQGMAQPKAHHPEGDSWAHTIEALKVARTNDPITNICILLHDVGKNKNTLDYKDGEPTYYGHHHESAKLVDQIADRLKFSNEIREAVKFVAENHMLGYQIKGGMKKSTMLSLINSPYWEHLKETFYADIMSRGIPEKIKDFNDIVGQLEEVQKTMGQKQEFENKMKALVDGRMIMQLVPGIKGQDIGKIKDQTREWIINKKFNVTPEEVNDYIKKASMML